MIVNVKNVHRDSTSCQFCSQGKLAPNGVSLIYPYENVLEFGHRVTICSECLERLCDYAKSINFISNNDPVLRLSDMPKTGDVLIAISPCVMESGEPTLTIGKEYVVTDRAGRAFIVTDDAGHPHYFEYQHFYMFIQKPIPEVEYTYKDIKIPLPDYRKQYIYWRWLNDTSKVVHKSYVQDTVATSSGMILEINSLGWVSEYPTRVLITDIEIL